MSLSITISNGDPNPNGTAAVMSRTGSEHPNSATWRALDKDYEVSLPSNVWSAPQGHQLQFTATQQETSVAYTLKSNASVGEQEYDIEPNPTMTGPPAVLVEP